jgi:hypothetical protein
MVVLSLTVSFAETELEGDGMGKLSFIKAILLQLRFGGSHYSAQLQAWRIIIPVTYMAIATILF